MAARHPSEGPARAGQARRCVHDAVRGRERWRAHDRSRGLNATHETPLRVGVVGLGHFAQLHLAGWRGIGAAVLAGVADADATKVAEAVRSFDAAGFATAAALLDSARPDILDIVVPPPAHAALVRDALASRHPPRVVVCQKPFCTGLAEARAVTRDAEAAGVVLLVHENFRFQPWYRALKAWLDAGHMGTTWQARFDLRPGDGRGADAYLARQPAFRSMPRLLVYETGVHFLDVFTWLFGEATSVYADLRRLNPDIAGEDAGTVMLEHAGGTRSTFDGNRLSDRVSDEPRLTMGELVVEGETGTVRLDTRGRLWLRGFGARDESELPVAPFDAASFGGGCVEALNRHVVDALAGRAPFENRARDYLRTVALVEAAYRSAEEGRRVALPADD